MIRPLLFLVFGLATCVWAAEPRQVSGIYPGLAMFNKEGECGTGAVVPWADRLWVITYAPHEPNGSTDKLYEITPDLKQIIRSESVGGTPANRMIHRETNQLLIGPYIVDAQRAVRVLSPQIMPGRLTGVARHLTQPATHAYYATMEEGLYSVDLTTLAVTGLIKDGNRDIVATEGIASHLPGYHGKGLYTGQGRVVYANNGEYGKAAETDPSTPSGALAEWNKPGQEWTLIRRNQFTEVTGPGGIFGNEHPDTDPIWTIGWDHRSLILMCLDQGKWHSYRLPKGSHSYDGAHGWNTEWPRIRDIGEKDLLMTMHGTFWKFPKTFSSTQSAGISPRSNYLKVIGDFALWNNRLVLGCDDTAKNEFLNKRKAKGEIAGPGQSQSNLWFLEPTLLDNLGPVIGRGSVWFDEDVKAGTPSDPYLFNGYDDRGLELFHQGGTNVRIALEIDAKGDGKWAPLRSVDVPPGKGLWIDFPSSEKGSWIRLVPETDCKEITAAFSYRNKDSRDDRGSGIFAPVATPSTVQVNGGLIYARGKEEKTLRYAAQDAGGVIGLYDLDADLNLVKVEEPGGFEWMNKNLAIPSGVLAYDDASILYVDAKGRWRLPRGDSALDKTGPLGNERVCREVCTERDLFNAGGTFFELPAENAGGASKIRPVATHNRRIKDYTSYRGLFVMTGLKNEATAGEHVVRSADGKASLWVGAVDDLWKFGKPRGLGGPWKNSEVLKDQPSDPYLFTGYDRKTLSLSHDFSKPVNIRVEVDPTGTGLWVLYQSFEVAPGKAFIHQFPDAFGAYWVRLVADQDCRATGQLEYK